MRQLNRRYDFWGSCLFCFNNLEDAHKGYIIRTRVVSLSTICIDVYTVFVSLIYFTINFHYRFKSALTACGRFVLSFDIFTPNWQFQFLFCISTSAMFSYFSNPSLVSIDTGVITQQQTEMVTWSSVRNIKSTYSDLLKNTYSLPKSKRNFRLAFSHSFLRTGSFSSISMTALALY